MILPASKCLVFFTDEKRQSGIVKVAACQENIIQDDFRVSCQLSLKDKALKGDLNSIFQAQFSEKNPQKFPYLYTC
jgi:hypothetical protein